MRIQSQADQNAIFRQHEALQKEKSEFSVDDLQESDVTLQEGESEVSSDGLSIGDEISGTNSDGEEVSGVIDGFSFEKPTIDGRQISDAKKTSRRVTRNA